MDKKKYKVGVIGLGPIGQILAVHFKEAGCEVAITDVDKDKLTLIKKSGIELVDTIEKQAFFKHVYNSIEELMEHDIDLLVSAVKAYHVNQIIAQIKNCPNNNVFVLTAQNGLGIRRKYTSHFSESKILRMVINFAGSLNAPNTTAVSFFSPPNFVASIDDSHPGVADWVAEILTSSGIATERCGGFTIVDKAWEKAILNAALSPICAISQLTMKEAMNHPDTLEIVEQLIYEAVEVAKAEEIKLPENFTKLCIRYLKNAGNHMPSLAIDLLNHRPTEIEFMNGRIVEYGKKHYIKTPLNLTLTNLVRAISHKNGKCADAPGFII